MDFENMVAPLMAPRTGADGQWNTGSGFLARINGEIFLATVARLCDYYLAPRADWSLWPEKMFLADAGADEPGGLMKPIGAFDLFLEGPRGKRVPRFKYFLRQERPGTIADIILLPVDTDDLIAKTYKIFDLPSEVGAHTPGAVVTQLGRRNDFPALSATRHASTHQARPLRFMTPAGEEGDSGGPAIGAAGLLLGMNVGSHEDLPGEAMLMSPESIEALATAVRGVARSWPQFQSEGPLPDASRINNAVDKPARPASIGQSVRSATGVPTSIRGS